MIMVDVKGTVSLLSSSFFLLLSPITYYLLTQSEVITGNVRPRPRPAPQLSIDYNMDVPEDVHYQLKHSLYMLLSQ